MRRTQPIAFTPSRSPAAPLLAALATLVTFVGAPPAAAQDAQSPPWQALGLDRAVHWTQDPDVFLDGRRVKRSITNDIDRSALLDQAISTARDQERLVLWYVYRIVENASRGRQMYRAPVLDLYMQQVVFNDPDVASIIERRFVPIRMVCDEALSERFGLRPLTFVEPAVVFLDGKGEVVHVIERIRTFSGHWFADLLRRVLRASDTTPYVARSAEDAIAAGEYERALKLLEPDQHYLRATVLRRLRQPQNALDELGRISGDDREQALAAALERGRLFTLMGRPADAVEVLRPLSPESAEGGYLCALNLLALSKSTEATRQFEAVATAHPDTPFGRRARANVTDGPDQRPFGAAFSGFEHITWLPDAAYDGLPRDTTWAGPPPSRQDMIVRGVQFLLAQQRDDGGFTDSRYAYWPTPKITPNAWVAITALAATALAAHRDADPERIDPEAIDGAVRAAESFVFDREHMNRGENEDVYADAYRLCYLAQKHGHSAPEAQAAIVDRMNEVIREAERRQARDGFFAHEYRNAFCTAAMLWGLHEARNAGADVPPEMISKGLAALVSARSDSGAYSYGGAARGRGSSVKDSSGRMPLCEGTLLAFGHSDLHKVGFAFETYWGTMDRIEQVRRNDFHSDGELAGFFFFHDLFHASQINRLLPEDEQKANDRKFEQLLQRIPEMDGSFVDSHELGRSYGTAMALLVLADLRG